MIIQSIKPQFNQGSHLSVEFLNIKHQAAHTHPDAIELVYCLAGSLNVKIAHEEFTITAGELITLDHVDVHALWAEDDNMILLIHLDAAGLSANWDKERYYFFSCASPLHQPHQHVSFIKICNLLLCAGFLYIEENRDAEQYDKISQELYKTLCSDFQWFSLVNVEPSENEKYWLRLHDLLEYITDHYNEKITLSNVADKIYVDKIYLSQFFKRTSFISFLIMVNYMRCYNAEKLLLFTDKSIHDISYECGFSSTKYFHRYFKAFWLITPLQHRKWYQHYAEIPEDVSLCTRESLLDPFNKNVISKYMEMLVS